MQADGVPVIHASALIEDECTNEVRESIGREICNACRRYGFFLLDFKEGDERRTTSDERRATNDERRDYGGLNRALQRLSMSRTSATHCTMDSCDVLLTFDDCAAWFARDVAVKSQCALANGQGYQKLGLNVTQGKRDAHEALDFFRPYPAHIPGTLKGPQPRIGDDTLQHKVNCRAKALVRLGHVVMRAIACGLGLSDDAFEDDIAGCPFWIMRLISSPPVCEEDVDGCKISCGAHTDYGLLTFLEASAPGLQIQLPNTDWINVPHIRGTVVCNVGEMLATLTNNEFAATLHRVIRTKSDGCDARISIGFFYETNYDAVISPIDDFAPFHAMTVSEPKYYSDFLMAKVSTNFADG